MGIRFYCPNGHKLNVKESQAGQKGICPRCGATMQIPLESTRRTSKSPSSPPTPEPDTISPEPLVTPIYPHHLPRHAPPRRIQLIVFGALLFVLLILSIVFLLIAKNP
jgi:hypothetical protein